MLSTKIHAGDLVRVTHDKDEPRAYIDAVVLNMGTFLSFQGSFRYYQLVAVKIFKNGQRVALPAGDKIFFIPLNGQANWLGGTYDCVRAYP